jgi:hypothetical protein
VITLDDIYNSEGGDWQNPSSAFAPQQAAPQLAPLPSDRNRALDNTVRDLFTHLNFGQISDGCWRNVIDRLTMNINGFNIGNLVRFLGGSTDFYDGMRSQAPVAGIVSPPQAANILYGTGATIAGVFNSRPGLNAMTSVTSSTFMAFFRLETIDRSNNGVNGRNLSLLFHEAIHGLTGRVDEDIQRALGIPVDPNNTGNITQHIRDNCF